MNKTKNKQPSIVNVLVVEDDKETATYVAKGLTECGHVADIASDGREGLLMADSSNYHVIIVDRMLPKVDGVTLTRTLRGNNNRTPILMLSALGEVDDRVTGLKAGADDYLTKPFAFSELQARIEALVRRAEPDTPDTVLEVWDYHFDPQTNVIDVHISRLRGKIDKEFDLPLLHTVRGAGYMLSESD